MDIQNAKDILFLALSAFVVTATVVLIWLAVYIIPMVREAREATKLIAQVVTTIHSITEAIQEAVERSSNHLALIVSAVQQLVSFFHKRHEDAAAPEPRSGNGKRVRR